MNNKKRQQTSPIFISKETRELIDIEVVAYVSRTKHMISRSAFINIMVRHYTTCEKNMVER